MQIVIEISEDEYKTIKSNYENGFTYRPFGIIANGTPLPKGHGDLIDRGKLQKSDLAPEPWYRPMWGYSEWEVEDAPTILEADKESKSE